MIKIIAKIWNKKEEEITELLNSKEKKNFENNYTINLYTEGLKQNIIQTTITKDNENIFTYRNYQNNKTINVQDNILITINKLDENEIDLDYNIKKENITGKLIITSKKISDNEQNTNVTITVNTKELKCSINIDASVKINQNIDIPNIANAKKLEELKEEDYLNIFINLENVLKDTVFYQLIESNIM